MSQSVIIAGAGPVGLMLACELGLAGVQATVLERLDQPRENSRGMAINATVIELLEQRGLMDPLRGSGFEFPQSHFAHLWTDPTKLTERHPYTFAVPHSVVERVLAERAVSYGARIRYGTEVVSLSQDGDQVEVGIRSSAGEGTETGRYLIGCDGADSAVRGLAQIGFPGTDDPFRGVIGDLELEPGDPLFSRIGVNQHERGFVTIIPVGPQTLRVTTGEFGVEPDDVTAPVTFADLSTTVERISGTGVTSGTPRWLIRWGAPARHAGQYRSGRVFLAGDAAHVHFPLGGQALSTGIEDAVDLGWKLAAAVNGWAPPELLDTYHAERHPVGARAVLTARAQTALLYPMSQVAPLRTILTELIEFEDVNDYLVRMATGLDVRYQLDYPGTAPAQPHPLQGRRLPDVPLTTATGETSTARLLQAGRGVLLDLSDAAEAAEAAAGWASLVDVVAAKPTAEISARLVLLRPDGRVAWAGDGPEPGLEMALTAWFGPPAAAG